MFLSLLFRSWWCHSHFYFYLDEDLLRITDNESLKERLSNELRHIQQQIGLATGTDVHFYAGKTAADCPLNDDIPIIGVYSEITRTQVQRPLRADLPTSRRKGIVQSETEMLEVKPNPTLNV